jgi:hypothetical protein
MKNNEKQEIPRNFKLGKKTKRGFVVIIVIVIVLIGK